MSNTVEVSASLPLPIIMGTHLLTENNVDCYSNLLLLWKTFLFLVKVYYF